jgi:chromosome segregation ATPase
MRYLYMAAALAWLGAGCAGITPAQLRAQVLEAERWQRQYEEQREHAEALAMRLAQAEAALEVARLERAEVALERLLAADELARAESELHALEEHNAQLRVRQRELTELHEELADVWYESALSRARRHLPARPVEPAAGGGNGAAP